MARMPLPAALSRLCRPAYRLVDLIFPPACAGCDALLPPGHGSWCPSCLDELLKLTARPACPRCGRGCPEELVSASGCVHCRQEEWELDGLARAGAYAGPLASLVRRFKYHGQQHLDRDMAALMAAAVSRHRWRGDLDVLTPVPIRLSGRWHYGFHPVGLLARTLGPMLGVPAVPLLRVIHKRYRQVELTAAQRLENVRGAYGLLWGCEVNNARVGIVDDVSTTGATLNEIARLLRRHGARSVHGIVLARGHLS